MRKVCYSVGDAKVFPVEQERFGTPLRILCGELVERCMRDVLAALDLYRRNVVVSSQLGL